MTEAVDVGDLSNVVLSLALVITFIFGAAFVLRRTPFGALSRSHGPLKVVAALPLGPRERLLLVQARDAELLIAVSPAGVFKLAAAGPGTAAGAANAAAAEAPAAFTLGESR